MRTKYILSILVSIVSGATCNSAWARLAATDEAALTACGYVQRNEAPFIGGRFKREDFASPEAVLRSEWLDYPSENFDAQAFLNNPASVPYRSAMCENALQNILFEMTGTEQAFARRCQALSNSLVFQGEIQNGRNSFLSGRNEIVAHTDAENYWCSPSRRGESDLINVACGALDFRRKMGTPGTSEYRQAREALTDRCGRFMNNRGVANVPGAAGNNGPMVVRRYVYPQMVQPQMMPQQGIPGCQAQATRALVITPPGGALYTVANAFVAGLGAVLSYKGGVHADNLKHNYAMYVAKSNAQLGLGTNIYAGGSGAFPGQAFYGQGGMMPVMCSNGRCSSTTGMGACGVPPYNTAYTGCMGGNSGMPPWGMNQGNCASGNCGGGFPGTGYPGYGNVGPGGSGCPSGNCGHSPYGSPYMNGPVQQGNPYGYGNPNNPYAQQWEQQRLRDLQNQIRQQQQLITQANRYRQQLGPLQNRLQQDQRAYGSALQGYNGILSNLLGPSGAYGHPGSYAGGPCQGGSSPYGNGGGCGAGGMPNGCAGGRCGGCQGIACYPGNPAAYYAPPYVMGNGGLGGSQYGYPTRGSSISFGASYNWSALPSKAASGSAR